MGGKNAIRYASSSKFWYLFLLFYMYVSQVAQNFDTIFFFQRIEKILPSLGKKPFYCPLCPFMGKDRQCVVRHYTGKDKDKGITWCSKAGIALDSCGDVQFITNFVISLRE